MQHPEHFDFERSTRWLFLAAPCMCVAAMLFFTALPFMPEPANARNNGNDVFWGWLAVIGNAGMAFPTWYSFKMLRRLPRRAISLDEEGLWPTIDGKDKALVRWLDIARIRERPWLNRVEALDASGRTVITLEGLLSGFQRLLSLVLERASLQPIWLPPDGIYRQPWRHRVFSIAGPLLLAGVIGYAAPHNPTMSAGGALLFTGLAIWTYWNMPIQLRLTADALEVHWPFRSRRVPKECIAAIDVNDEPGNRSEGLRITITLVRPAQAIQLRGFGLPAIDLQQALIAWRNDAR